MSKNPAFSKALSSLTHPASLVAMAAILINDHFIRNFHPSWLTGKISDFAWLLFFPFVIAAILSIILPMRINSRDRLIGLLSIALIGGLFALGKVFPAVNQAVLVFFGSLLGRQLSIVVDPTDLIALPMVWVGWRIWRQADPTLDLRIARGWAALPLAALLTLGNAAAPNRGVTCLVLEGNTIFASANYYNQGSFISVDGGLTWKLDSTQTQHQCPETTSFPHDLVTLSGVQYRYEPEEDIQISTDGGKTWNVAFDIQPVSESEQELFDKKGFNGISNNGPLAAIEDVSSGNILFAMGWEGILVRTGDQWVWSAVGDYQQMHPETAENLFALLNLRLILAVGAGMITILFASTCLNRSKKWKIGYILAWVAWLGGVIISITGGAGYIGAIAYPAIFLASLYILVMGIEAIFRFIRQAQDAILPVAITAFTAMLLFAIPYLLWALNIIPQYWVAMLISIGLVFAVLLPSRGRLKKIVENAISEE